MDLGFYIYPMKSQKVNPNNAYLTLHKGNQPPPLAQTKVPFRPKLPNEGKKPDL